MVLTSLAFVVGLMGSNTVVAIGARAGMLSAAGNWAVYATVSVLVAVFSLGLGVSYLLA
ncbi:MAG: hypothetical protein HYU28_01900 [Actinobacteria bacterium]|nr:hypothetical protein [Actinomycetota bacterium]